MSQHSSYEIKETRYAIVILSTFDPAWFSPYQLAQKNLIPSREAEDENTSIEYITRQITEFELPWCSIQVARNRLFMGTRAEEFVNPLRDLASGILTLQQTSPIRAIGLNLGETIEVKDNDKFNQLGYRLVPKDNWVGLMKEPGMHEVAVRSPRDEDPIRGYFMLTIKPVGPQLVNAAANDHYASLEPAYESQDASTDPAHEPLDANRDPDHEALDIEYALKLLNEDFSPSIERSKQAIKMIWSSI